MTGSEQIAAPEGISSDWCVLNRILLLAVLTITVKTVGAAKTIIIAQSFGAGRALDAYLLAFLAPSFICDVLSGAVAPSLIPVLVDARHRGGYRAACSIYAGALYRCVLLLGGAALILGTVGSALLAHGDALTVRLLLMLLPMVPISAVANVWRATLNAEGRFVTAAATPALTPLVTIAILYSAARPFHVDALAIGTTVGMAAEALILGMAVRKAGFPILPAPGLAERNMRPVIGQFGAIGASNLVMTGSALIDQSMAALLGPGSLSILSYGTRLLSLLVAVGPAALSTAVLPRLSETIAHRQWRRLRTSVHRYLLVGIAVAVPVTAALIWASAPIVHIVFERGAFTSADTRAVASVQACSLLQFPLAIGIAILTRVIASLRENQFLVPVSVAGLIGNAGLDYLLMNRFGVAGIVIASTSVNALIVLALAAVATHRIRVRDGSSI